MTLTDFLLARIADDEAVAREAAWGHLGFVDWALREDGIHSMQVETLGPDPIAITCDHEGLSDSVATRGAGLHIARHDPARVLAECAAKRRIVEMHKSWPVLVETPPKFSADTSDLTSLTMRMSQQVMWATEQEYRERFGAEPPTAPILRVLATVWADHPDYDEEWRP